jgi:hypothetical protein
MTQVFSVFLIFSLPATPTFTKKNNLKKTIIQKKFAGVRIIEDSLLYMVTFKRMEPKNLKLQKTIIAFSVLFLNLSYMIFKFRFRKFRFLRTNNIVGFFYPLLRSPEIGFELGTSQINIFFITFQNNEYFTCGIGQK